jgi:hypothetical protein
MSIPTQFGFPVELTLRQDGTLRVKGMPPSFVPGTLPYGVILSLMSHIIQYMTESTLKKSSENGTGVV